MLLFNPKIYIRHTASFTNLYTIEQLSTELSSNWTLVGDTLEKPSITSNPDKIVKLSTGVDYVGSDKIDFNFKSIDTTLAMFATLKDYTNSNNADIIYVDIENNDPNYVIVKNVKFDAKLIIEGGEFATIEISGSKLAKVYSTVIDLIELNRATIKGVLRNASHSDEPMVKTNIKYTDPTTGLFAITVTDDDGKFNFTFKCDRYNGLSEKTKFEVEGRLVECSVYAGTNSTVDLLYYES